MKDFILNILVGAILLSLFILLFNLTVAFPEICIAFFTCVIIYWLGFMVRDVIK